MHLGVRPAGALVRAAPDDDAVVVHDHARRPSGSGWCARAHARERAARAPCSARRQSMAAGRPLYHFSSNSASTYSSRRERNQVVDAFADADVADRQLQIVRDRDGDAALRGAIELRQHDAVHAGDAHELARLRQAVLPDGRVEHQQHFVRRALDFARRRCARILSSSVIRLTRVCSRPAVSTRIDVALARLAGRDRVEHDRRRIGAVLRADEVDAGARRPDLAAARRPPRGTCRPRRSAACCPASLSSLASFPTVVVLPVPLTPTISTTCGRGR